MRKLSWHSYDECSHWLEDKDKGCCNRAIVSFGPWHKPYTVSRYFVTLWTNDKKDRWQTQKATFETLDEAKRYAETLVRMGEDTGP